MLPRSPSHWRPSALPGARPIAQRPYEPQAPVPYELQRAQKDFPVTVYTALENDQLGPYKAAFEAENPKGGQGLGEQPQWLYAVCFDGRELWGDEAQPGLSVSIDAWDDYLEPA